MELEYKGKFNFSYQKFDENNLSILKKSLLDDFVEMLQLDLDNFQNQLIDDGVLSSDENMLENSKIKFYPIVGESDFTLQEFLKMSSLHIYRPDNVDLSFQVPRQARYLWE